MQLIKSLRSFGRWLFNIKDEVKPYSVYENRQFSHKIYVTGSYKSYISYRFQNSLIERHIPIKDFHKTYRKIS